MEPLNPISLPVEQPCIIPWEEQLQDHNQKIEEYLRNLVFRGCTYETTVKKARIILKRLFDGLQIEDPNHPRGSRQILVWELLDPAPRESGTRSKTRVHWRAARVLRLCPCQA